MGISATVDGFVSSLGATCLSGASAIILSVSGTARLSQNPAPATAAAANIHLTPRLVIERSGRQEKLSWVLMFFSACAGETYRAA
jgi:hypothetical protein